MAERPFKETLPADLPENWQAEQIVAPTGEEVGLTRQHGYNYLMEMVNRTQQAANAFNEAFETVSGKRTCRFVVGTSQAGWTAGDCDYLCDGTDDQVEIQAAIDALPKEGNDAGGEIVLLSGVYHLTGIINISPYSITLTGNGDSTVLMRETAEGAGTIKRVIALAANCTLSNLVYRENQGLVTEGYPIAILSESRIQNVKIYNAAQNDSGGCIYVELAKNSSGGGFAEISGCLLYGRGGKDHGAVHLKSGGDVRVLNNIAMGTLISSSPDCNVHLLARGNTSALGAFYTGIYVDGLARGSMILENDLDYLSILNTNDTTGSPGHRFLGQKCLVSGNVFRAANPDDGPAITLGSNTTEIFVTGNLLCNQDAPAYGVEDSGTGNIVRFNSNDLSGSGGTPTTVAQAVPELSVTPDGLITATSTQAAGNVPAGTRTATKQLSAQDDPDLVPGNIREGVSILGVAGSMKAGSTTEGITSDTISKIEALTQSEYDALATKDAATLYLIKE